MESKTYFPELLSRKSEKLTWALFAISFVSLLLLRLHFGILHIPAAIFVLLLFLAAGSISLGNWMDRHTSIVIDANGVSFSNGIRHAAFKWQEIDKIHVLESHWGNRVQVLGKSAHFEFRTLGKVILNGDLKGQLGFKDGDVILQTLLEKSGLRNTSVSEKNVYYTRP